MVTYPRITVVLFNTGDSDTIVGWIISYNIHGKALKIGSMLSYDAVIVGLRAPPPTASLSVIYATFA